MSRNKKKSNWKSILVAAVAVAAGGTYLAVDNGGSPQVAPGPEMETSIEASSPASGSLMVEQLERPARLDDVNEKILEKKGFAISYNSKTCCPNWVAWELNADKLKGTLERKEEFDYDHTLPRGDAVMSGDYSRSGFDRGHMCPAGDNKWSEDAMRDCFYMTNICPQDHELNRGVWNDLEQRCRAWARKDGCIYIVCGPIYNGELYQNKTIGHWHKVRVPDAFFKVVLSVAEGKPKAMGFIMKNNSTVSGSITSFATTVDNVEEKTGIDFFPALPDDIENQVESQYNIRDWRY